MSTFLLGFTALCLTIIGYIMAIVALYFIRQIIKYSVEHLLLFISIFVEFPLILVENILFVQGDYSLLKLFSSDILRAIFFAKLLILFGALGMIVYLIRVLIIFEKKLFFFIFNSALAGSFITSVWFAVQLKTNIQNKYTIVYSSIGLGILIILTISLMMIYSVSNYLQSFYFQKKYSHTFPAMSKVMMIELFAGISYFLVALMLYIQRILLPEFLPVNAFTMLVAIKNILVSIGVIYLPISYRLSPKVNGISVIIYSTKNNKELLRIYSKEISDELLSLRSMAIMGTTLVASEITEDKIQQIVISGHKNKIIVSRYREFMGSVIFSGDNTLIIGYALNHMVKYLDTRQVTSKSELFNIVVSFLGFMFKYENYRKESQTGIITYEFINSI